MRETSFIRQNKKKWKEFEQILARQDSEPEQLNELFVQITDDLSYSRTFYPNRSVRVYLNNLAQQIFFSLYKNKKTRFGKLISFWTEELPQLVHQARPEFRLSFLLFALSFFIGMVSCAMDPDFPRAILGDAYVDMSLENIESGDPMAVYKQRGQFGMSLGITANNLFVAFLTFVLGAFFAIGTAAIMLSNGVMVGAFQYFFYDQGLLRESFLTIWTHGTLEISAIIIAGAAGLTMGKGLIFPGTLSRLQAFQISARRGLKIMIGITPIIILAGFIEGYLTRYTETPDIVRALFILLCLSFVLGYFVWYPRLMARRGFKLPLRDTELRPDTFQRIALDRIKPAGEVFAEVFILCKRHLQYVAGVAFAMAAIYCLMAFPFANELPAIVFNYKAYFLGTLFHLDQFFINEEAPFLLLAIVAIFTICIYYLYPRLTGYLAEDYPHGTIVLKSRLHHFLTSFVTAMLLALLIVSNSWYTLISFMLVAPILLLWAFVMLKEKAKPILGFQRTLYLVSGAYGRLLGLFALLFSVSMLFFAIMDTSFVWFYFELISWNLPFEQELLDQIGAVIITFVNIFVLSLIFIFILIGIALSYFNLLEIKEASGLLQKIQAIGLGKQIQGIDKEN